ncbi:ATP-binding protein [uncultured Paludibaculum sp.]|uniref:two-component system sensor histidine kinase NtrB n=1 Tax=uncultured Paludibaculum sp. TaxID=1765020 RepID=UPI002AABE500|nr:ATP-binding protein [uncultured Paludibaculum sp.]
MRHPITPAERSLLRYTPYIGTPVEPEHQKTNWGAIALVAAAIAAISAGHYFTPPSQLMWHGVFQRAYYLPVVFAAITFGWIGGLTAAAVAGLAYVPHIMTAWTGMRHYEMEQYVEIIMFFAVGAVTGILADQERHRRLQLQQTARQLSKVYEELQNTFEQVKRADRLSAIGQLAAGLAHEIRNPLASIDGAAEVLLAGGEPEEVRQETLGIIRKECGRLNRLLTSLLDFARPRRPEWREVNLAGVLDKVLELVAHSAKNGIRFTKEFRGGPPKLVCDEEQLAQVLLNLLLNATQAMPRGGEVHVDVEATRESIEIRVKDQGDGISEDLLDHIFDPFFTTKDTGTGLGLSVVHQIVSQHGGKIAVTRNPDRGLLFTLSFPQKQADRP